MRFIICFIKCSILFRLLCYRNFFLISYDYLFLQYIFCLRYCSSLFILDSCSLFWNIDEILFDNISSCICARRSSSLFFSFCGFYLVFYLIVFLFYSFLSLSTSFFYFLLYVFVSRTNVLSCVDSSFSFSFIRACFLVHILFSLSLSLSSSCSLSHPFFNVFLFLFFILVDVTFALVHRAW